MVNFSYVEEDDTRSRWVEGNDMIDPRFIVYPGIKIGANQNYTLTWEYETFFVTHKEDWDEIIFNAPLDDDKKEDIEFLLRQYLIETKKDEPEDQEDLTFEDWWLYYGYGEKTTTIIN